MNVYVLDADPVLAAQMQCDKHVVKMVLETAQLLSTAHRVLDGKLVVQKSKTGRRESVYVLEDPEAESKMYRATHANHPCAKWLMASVSNYNWLYRHFEGLCDEYKFRYGKVHSCDSKLRGVLDDLPTNLSDVGPTAFALAMKAHPECIHPEDTVRSYREYYRTKVGNFKMVWTKREVPAWFKKI